MIEVDDVSVVTHMTLDRSDDNFSWNLLSLSWNEPSLSTLRSRTSLL